METPWIFNLQPEIQLLIAKYLSDLDVLYFGLSGAQNVCKTELEIRKHVTLIITKEYATKENKKKLSESFLILDMLKESKLDLIFFYLSAYFRLGKNFMHMCNKLNTKVLRIRGKFNSEYLCSKLHMFAPRVSTEIFIPRVFFPLSMCNHIQKNDYRSNHHMIIVVGDQGEFWVGDQGEFCNILITLSPDRPKICNISITKKWKDIPSFRKFPNWSTCQKL